MTAVSDGIVGRLRSRQYRARFGEFLLATGSITVLMLAIQTSPAEHQIVEVHRSPKHVQRYSVGLNDPSLHTIRDLISRQDNPEMKSSLLSAKWRCEAANHYADRAAVKLESTRRQIQQSVDREGDLVKQVSFLDPRYIASLEKERLQWQLQYEHWTSVRDRAQSWLSNRDATEHPQLAAPTFRLGPRVEVRSYRALTAAFIVGLFGAGILSWRSIARPARVLAQTPSGVTILSSDIDGRPSAIVVSKSAVAPRQPIEVNLRRVILVCLVLGALVCSPIVFL